MRLWPILNKVEQAWKKRQAQLEQFLKTETWLTLGKRVDLPMRELHENLIAVTESRRIKTERDRLKEENKNLKRQLTDVMDMLFNLSPSSPTLSEQVEKIKGKVLESGEESTAVLRLQSIWRALKVRRNYKIRKAKILRAVITIQRYYQILSVQKDMIQYFDQTKKDNSLAKRIKRV